MKVLTKAEQKQVVLFCRQNHTSYNRYVEVLSKATCNPISRTEWISTPFTGEES